MRVAISVNVNPKDPKGYDLLKAYEENEVLPFVIRQGTKGLKIGDKVYMWLTKPESNFRFICEVVGVGLSPQNTMDDTKYQYHPKERKLLIDESNGYYLFKKIKFTKRKDITLDMLRELHLTNMKFIQCCCKDENHGDMFDRLDLEFSKEK
jgi:hypothetical protein